MVAEVNLAGATLHQTLHGYDGGHTLLASSKELDPRSAASLLVMSDLAPVQTTVPDTGYLTGYPLPDAKAYAIARTWPAREMPRPGCVWTHTLLIDFSVMSRLSTIESLLSRHVRPQPAQFKKFRLPLSFGAEELAAAPPRLPVECISEFQALLQAIYASSAKVIALSRPHHHEQLSSALWDQQWPGLRRRFRFSTCFVSAGTSEVPAFDVQISDAFSSETSPLRDHRFVDLRSRAVASKKNRAGWGVAAAWDARRGGTRIRHELRRFGADVSSGRRAFPMLVASALLNTGSSAADIETLLLAAAREIPANEGQLLRQSVGARALSVAGRLTQPGLNVLLDLLPILSASPTQMRALAEVCWTQRRAEFWSALPASPAGHEAQLQFLSSLEPGELLGGIEEVTQAPLDQIYAIRPALALEPETWRREAFADSALSAAKSDATTRALCIRGILTAGAQRYFDDIAEIASSSELLQGFVQNDRGDGSALSAAESRWLDVAVDVQSVSQILPTELQLRRAILCAAARRVSPLAVSLDQPVDPWFDAWTRARGRAAQKDLEYFAAFSFIRCLQSRANDRGLVFAATYPIVDRMTDGGSIADDTLELLEKFLVRDVYFGESRRRRVARWAVQAAVQAQVPLDQYLGEAQWQDFRRFSRTVASIEGGTALLNRSRVLLPAERAEFVGELLGLFRYN